MHVFFGSFSGHKTAILGPFGFRVLGEDRMLSDKILNLADSIGKRTGQTSLECVAKCNLWDIYCLNWNGFGILSNIITTLPRCFQGESFSLTPATAPGN